jgi:hypothetical protein
VCTQVLSGLAGRQVTWLAPLPQNGSRPPAVAMTLLPKLLLQNCRSTLRSSQASLANSRSESSSHAEDTGTPGRSCVIAESVSACAGRHGALGTVRTVRSCSIASSEAQREMSGEVMLRSARAQA